MPAQHAELFPCCVLARIYVCLGIFLASLAKPPVNPKAYFYLFRELQGHKDSLLHTFKTGLKILYSFLRVGLKHI